MGEPSNVGRGTTDRRVAAARAAVENLRPDELAAELDRCDPPPVLVDVRSAQECAAGTLAGAINIPRGILELASERLVDPDRRLVVCCDTGERSALAAASLYAMGYHDVAHLDGGITAWLAHGYPVSLASD